MLRVLAAVMVLTFAVPATGAPATDPLAPARLGKVQCFQPTTHKTCQSIAAIAFTAAATIDTTTSILDADTMTVMRLSSPAIVRDGAVCTQLRKQDIAGAVIMVGGKPATPSEAQEAKAPFLASVEHGDSPLVCYTITRNGDRFTTHVTMNGKALPGQDFIWADSSYHVAP